MLTNRLIMHRHSRGFRVFSRFSVEDDGKDRRPRIQQCQSLSSFDFGIEKKQRGDIPQIRLQSALSAEVQWLCVWTGSCLIAQKAQ